MLDFFYDNLKHKLIFNTLSEITMTGQRARDLEAAYNHYLKKQIVDQGSSLPCRDENLCSEVEELLKNEDGRDTHCLGLDTFNIMEESLRLAGTDSKRAAKVRIGLRGLAKAFEVLEQAALNLYLGPWREEYKVVKMYSGIFTHCIKPVFSMQQIELLFGLLGYKKCSTQREQLRLQPQKLSVASMDELLRLSCAFFVGRCECRLLLAALGKFAGQPQWELNVVRERQRGHSLEIALDNTLRLVDVKQPLQELPEENDMDLYTDEQDGEEVAVDEAPRSLTWLPNNGANGAHREPSYVSTHRHRTSETDSSASDFPSISRYVSGFCKETSGEKKEALSVSHEEKADRELPCSCLKMKNVGLRACTECHTYHSVTCPNLEPCQRNHKTNIMYVDELPEQFFPRGALASQHKGSISPTLTRSSGALSSLTLREKVESFRSVNSPLPMHSCCEFLNRDPQVLCLTCQVFHLDYCNEAKSCISSHEAKKLGLCSEEMCSQVACILCKFCGNEYCKDCWYKNPINCKCGETLDFSSSV